MRFFNPRHLFILGAFLVLSACGSDDNDGPGGQEATPGSVTATINGESFSASGPFVTATISDSYQGFTTIGIAAAEGLVESKGIGLGIVIGDENDLSAGDTFTAQLLESTIINGAFAGYSETAEDINSGTEDTKLATIVVTKFDLDNMIISGTFSFDATDDDFPGMTWEVRDGVFTDIAIN